MDIINKDSSEADLIRFCAEAESKLRLTSPEYSNAVVKLSASWVIKYGRFVRQSEAHNQMRARSIVDPNIVYVPKVHRFFLGPDDRGYIVMEFIDGEHVSNLETESLQEQATQMLAHFGTLHSRIPGPLAGGSSPALIFGEQEEPEFHVVADIEQWINARLLKLCPPISLQGLQLSLCHMDIAPRNLLRRGDGSLCLLDWATSGFYPWFFEVCNQRLMAMQGHPFDKQLLECLRRPSATEENQINAILRAQFNCHKYYMPELRKQRPQGSVSAEKTPKLPRPPTPNPLEETTIDAVSLLDTPFKVQQG